MKVAVTGCSGLIGSALRTHLERRGDTVIGASRAEDGVLRWEVESGFEPPDALSGYDAVVHLAGENIASRRWSQAQKQRILDSRVHGTRAVVEALRRADPRPRVLVSGSAVGVYGDRGDVWLTEAARPGSDFLAEVCTAWEAQALEARALGVRVVTCRTGLVMATLGGPLPRMLPAFRLGLGGRLGSGRQYMSWIHVHDVVRAMTLALDDERADGPMNLVSPHPVTNAEFTETLGKVLRRPTLIPVPAFALRAAFGELSQLLLEGQRVEPTRLRDLGFEFDFPLLPAALEQLLG